MLARMSRWEMFPYVGGGKALGKKPLRVQILFFWALGATWIVAGILSPQRTLLADLQGERAERGGPDLTQATPLRRY